MEKEFIQEQTHGELIESWYAEAKAQTLDTVHGFVSKLCNNYSHDMNTICEAMCAGALGVLSAMDKSSEGDIAPAQQAKLLGLFVRKWARVDGPAKIISWWGILNPENEKHFATVPSNVVESLKPKAVALLNEIKSEEKKGIVHQQSLKDHLQMISEGRLPWGLKEE